MDKEFINYEEALALRELGFDKKCIKGFFNKEEIYTVVTTPVDFNNKSSLGELVSCPTYSQAFRWFREKHNLHPSFTRYTNKSIQRNPQVFPGVYEITIIDENNGVPIFVIDTNSYEEAELACLKKLIEICQTEQKRNLQE